MLNLLFPVPKYNSGIRPQTIRTWHKIITHILIKLEVRLQITCKKN
jgi:hypothetical protein